MNFALIAKSLGIVSLLVGASMALCLPWALPACSGTPAVEWKAVGALAASMAIAVLLGFGLIRWGRGADDRMLRKEALAVVGLSWCLATVLGAVPFLLSGTCRGHHETPQAAGAGPGIPMSVFDAVFESASGFSGTGATVITDLEDPLLVPRAILFWRSATHFLGGLGIMVLFVAILGQGSAGKAIFRAELPGPSKDVGHSRVQHAAWTFAAIYIGLNAVLTVLLLLQGVGVFDALCHAFGTIATGGFSTYNDSVSHFHSLSIEMTVALFMAVSCVNFALIYYVILLRPGKLFADVEFRAYLATLATATALAVVFGLAHGDFENVADAVRYSLFQVTSILTNTGFGTHDFDRWNEFGRGLLFFLMFVGGCAGSTSCSIKVIRYLILGKTLWLQTEQVYRPSVIRPLRLNGEPVEAEVVRDVVIYFAAFLWIAVIAWLFLVAIEPDATWAGSHANLHDKLMDCASAVAATMNGVGPGLGIVGATQNYAGLQPLSKLLLSFLMLLGRLEIFPILVLLTPRFWGVRQ